MSPTQIGWVRAVSPLPTTSSPVAPEVAEPPLLPPPALGPLDAASVSQLAFLLTEADAQDRTQARQIEQEEDHAATVDESERVQQLFDKAGDDGAQALWSGLGDIASGLCTFANAFAPASEDAVKAKATDWRTVLGAGSKIAPGLATILSGGEKVSADRADAAAASADAQSQAHLRAYDAAQSEAQAAADSIEKVNQFLEQIEQTQAATSLAAATIRA